MNELEFSKKIADYFKDTNYLVKTEISSGYGIADVVAIKVNDKHIKKRLGYAQYSSILSENYFKVLDIIGETKESASSIKSITKNLTISDAYVKNKIIKDLIKDRFIEELEGKMYMKINGWAPLSNEVIAIESKLHNWNRGLTQALRYKTFADKVYLALPIDKVHLVERNLLKNLNIGLITLNHNRLNWIFHPVRQKKEIIESKKDYVCEHFWREMKISVGFS